MKTVLIKKPTFTFTNTDESAVQVIYWEGETVELNQDGNEIILKYDEFLKLFARIKKHKEEAYEK